MPGRYPSSGIVCIVECMEFKIGGLRRLPLWLVMAVFWSVLLSSCGSIRYVPVETVYTDSVYFTIYQRDSIYMRDSVYVLDKGDTVYQFRYKYLFVDKVKHDTLYIERTDSIQVPYPVEKELTRWQSFKQEAGGFAIATIVVLILIVFGKMVYKLRKGCG